MGVTRREEDSYAWVWEKLSNHISAKRLKHTRQRGTIVSCITKMANHFSAEDLYNNLKSRGYAIGLATIYRTLALLKESGIINQVTFENDESSLFELNTPLSHHDHMICVICGGVKEFENLEIENLQKEVAARQCAHLVSHRLNLYVKCSECLVRQEG